MRLLTYNVHRCLGVDGVLSPERIAQVIGDADPDIVALQELDVGRARSGGVDQAKEIARLLGMQSHFHAALRVEEESYGDAILTRLPSRLVRAALLPGLVHKPLIEPRGALWVEVQASGQPLQVLNTHLGLVGAERVAQVDCLLGPAWLGHPDCRAPVILAGDFNAPPFTAAYRRLHRVLTDARAAPAGEGRRATFPSRFPLLALDHVFFHGQLEVRQAAAIRTPLARLASDHLPLLVELGPPAWPGARPDPEERRHAGAIADLRR